MNFERLCRTLGLSLSSVLLMSQFAFAQQGVMAPIDEDDDTADEVELVDDFAAADDFSADKTATGLAYKVFVHDVTQSNTSAGSHVTRLEDAAINANPDAMLYVTANWNPPGQSGVYNNHPIGVWHNGSQWTIFNEDFADMPMGASFTVRVGGGFLHEANASNIASHITYIDNPLTNNNPTARLTVTQNWGPGNAPGVYVNHDYGVWYNGSQWAIFNQDFAPMPDGATFNILVGEGFVHKASNANVTGHQTIIDNPLTNGRPDARLIVTQNWNPDGVGGTYNNHTVGVWYNGSKWVIFNEDFAAMPKPAAFNVVVANVAKVNTIKFVGTKVVILGEGFTNGAIVMVNGVDLPTKNNVKKPTTKLVCPGSANAFPQGQAVTVEIRNGDGLMSDPMSFTKQ
jgi:hypothetical protein